MGVEEQLSTFVILNETMEKKRKTLERISLYQQKLDLSRETLTSLEVEEKTLRETLDKLFQVKDQVVKDQVVKDQVVKDQVVKDQVVKDQVVEDQVVKDQVVKDYPDLFSTIPNSAIPLMTPPVKREVQPIESESKEDKLVNFFNNLKKSPETLSMNL